MQRKNNFLSKENNILRKRERANIKKKYKNNFFFTNVSKKHSLESFQFRFPNAINYKQKAERKQNTRKNKKKKKKTLRNLEVKEKA